MSGLLNIWNVAKDGMGNFIDFGAEKKEAKLGADINVGLMAQNFAPDMKEAKDEVMTIIENPRESANAFADLIGGAIGKVTPEFVKTGLLKVAPDNRITSDRTAEMATQAWEGIVATHGTLDRFKKYAQENPFDALLELTGAGLVAKQIKDVSAPIVLKAINEAELATTKLMMETENLATKLNEINPPMMPMVGARPIRSEEMRGVVDPQYVSGQPVGGKNQAAIDAANNVTRTVVGQAEDLIVPKQVSVRDFVGRWLLFTQSDRTDAGGNIVDINGIPISLI